MELESGWEESAAAYIALIDQGDPHRQLLLDPVVLNQCGDVRGLRVLDLGCGEGRFCRMLAERGATTVGVDPTGPMTRTAVARAKDGMQAYVRAGAESLPFGDATFDLVISYITLVDIAGFREAIAEAARVLRPGGCFVVVNVSFMSCSPQPAWERNADGKRLYVKIDRYLEEWSSWLEWAGIKIANWHRPLQAYMQAFLGTGLMLRDFVEPMPPDDSLRDSPHFEDWYRVPNFVVMQWEKPA